MKTLELLDKAKAYVGFTNGKGAIAEAIKWWTKGKVSHVFLLYWSPVWKCWVEHGAIGTGFNARRAGEDGFVKDLYALYEVEQDITVGMAINAKFLGAGYDYKALVGMSLVEAAQHWFKRNWDNPLDTDARWFCSEIVMRILLDSRVPLTIKSKPGSTDPQDLMVAVAAVAGCVNRYKVAA
jgi:hypothetical protein